MPFNIAGMPHAFAMKKMTLASHRGQAAVEFVLMLPILLLLASVAMDTANMVFVAHRLAAATREGARVATETTQPIPEHGDTGESCTISGCASGTSLCCLAVRRANLVLWNSGVQDPDNVTGRWIERTDNTTNRRYVMLQITATETVNFAFGLADQTLVFRSVGYGDDYPLN